MTVKIYVEGGGTHNKALQSECRRGFSELLKRAGLRGRMPRVVACGGRRMAYESFRTSHENGGPDVPVLLVDSEGPIIDENPWEHVRLRSGDGWVRPEGASQDQIHLMVQTMEAWFHADKDALQQYYGHGFRTTALSPRSDIEGIPKVDLFAGLKRATQDCQKGEYSKNEPSFQILARIDPTKLKTFSAVYAERFLNVLERTCSP